MTVSLRSGEGGWVVPMTRPILGFGRFLDHEISLGSHTPDFRDSQVYRRKRASGMSVELS